MSTNQTFFHEVFFLILKNWVLKSISKTEKPEAVGPSCLHVEKTGGASLCHTILDPVRILSRLFNFLFSRMAGCSENSSRLLDMGSTETYLTFFASGRMVIVSSSIISKFCIVFGSILGMEQTHDFSLTAVHKVYWYTRARSHKNNGEQG